MDWLRHSMTLALAAMISAASPALAAPGVNHWQEVAGIATPADAFLMDNGKQVTLADFKGQVIVLNLWATWCMPCLKELPTLDRLEETYAADGLVVLPISVDTIPFSQLRGFLDKRALQLPHLAQDTGNGIDKALVDGGLPITYLVDREGVLRARYMGSTDWMGKQAVAKVKALLAEGEAR